MNGSFKKTRRFQISASTLCLAFAAAWCSPSIAQTASDSPASTEQSNAVTDGDIIVTAQRRDQSVQKVPITISVVSQEAISNLSLRSVDKIAMIVPGLIYDTGYTIPETYIRGIGAQNIFGIGLEAPVATYVDGAYLARGLGGIMDTVDLGSIEVLKGPQGTLYGRNASGGAILIHTADPTSVLEGNATLEGGNFGHRLVDAVLNVPLSDTLAVRIAGRYRNDDGFVHNITTGKHIRSKESQDIRGKIKWTPSEAFTAILEADYHHDVGIAGAAGRQDAQAPLCVGCLFGGVAATNGFYQVTQDSNLREPARGYNVNLNLEYELGSITLKSVTAHRDVSAFITDDQDHTSAPFGIYKANYGGKTFSEDFQVSSDFGGMFDFIAGFQYVNDRAFQKSTLYGVAYGTPYTSPSVIPAGAAAGSQRVDTKSYAVFGELYVKPVDRVTVTLGGRYSKDNRDIRSDINALAVAIINPGGPGQFSQSASYHKFTPRVVLAYDAGNANFFASYTQGFKAGGFSSPAFAPQDVPIRPETITSYEVGAKLTSPDRRTHFNISAFYYRYRDVQVSIIDTAKGSQLVKNAAAANGKGVEFDVTHKPTPWLTLAAGGAYLHARYSSYPDGAIYNVTASGAVVSLADLSGTQLPRAPDWSGFASATAQGPVGGGWQARGTLLAHYSSSYLFSPGAGGPLGTDKQDSVTQVSASGGIGPESGAYEIGFYVDNLTDKKYYANRALGGFGINSLVAMPRTYGIRVKGRF